MIGHVAGGGSGRADRSFACLLAVYALHATIFHVLCLDGPADDVIRRTNVPRPDAAAAAAAVVVLVVPPKSRPENVTIFPRQRQILRLSELLPSRKNSTADRRRVTLKCGSQDSWFNWISNYSFIGGITSSTWAVISGCTIFLLTNCDRDELRDRRVNDKVDSRL
ncbi:uncharacterized protein LOC106656996 [Trichogramma pretiosum]|uniref:uncharacterized protein LOC106656996 n=1 Tax=Trichogramma pretiosum TaxID=7493 RepID=UPI0006C9E2DC|nr:uncharacterized protein LOC106656996 [Trichogramma pretiosum]XP_023317831.1 uncharacterized protein LOC106656996 [Trichogramma pretiosum]XP_023317832.1 uncharacterized protein LOC106656996 [Trichogramma pretiosum]XP_023317833.1 uncharacterized protein LOC106656996 [Trichogramma pretiosum]XP_023317834.1 uncharacterized protein LOC106656996 [Trichogramma pretiosum]